MKINELINERVILSRASITCKHDNKTAGIVRAERFTDLPPRVAVDYFHKLKLSGIWSAGKAKQVYVSGGNLYYLLNKRTIEGLEELANNCPFPYQEELDKLNELTAQAAEYVNIIPCYIEGGL